MFFMIFISILRLSGSVLAEVKVVFIWLIHPLEIAVEFYFCNNFPEVNENSNKVKK